MRYNSLSTVSVERSRNVVPVMSTSSKYKNSRLIKVHKDDNVLSSKSEENATYNFRKEMRLEMPLAFQRAPLKRRSVKELRLQIALIHV